MQYVELPETKNRLLPFYLAMEEYVANTFSDDCFFMWQVEPTVIFGRNQLMENEVNTDYCREHGIHTFRRKSGGGCVFADMSNVMLSMITSDESVNLAFQRFVSLIILALHKMGIEAVGSKNNDILIGDHKVSGTACYHLPNRSIVHSTLLYDTDMEHMLNAITPSTEKLQSKGIQSVRQRITLLKDHTSMTLEEVKELIRHTFCNGTMTLNAHDVAAIEQIEQSYLQEKFIQQPK